MSVSSLFKRIVITGAATLAPLSVIPAPVVAVGATAAASAIVVAAPVVGSSPNAQAQARPVLDPPLQCSPPYVRYGNRCIKWVGYKI